MDPPWRSVRNPLGGASDRQPGRHAGAIGQWPGPPAACSPVAVPSVGLLSARKASPSLAPGGGGGDLHLVLGQRNIRARGFFEGLFFFEAQPKNFFASNSRVIEKGHNGRNVGFAFFDGFFVTL